MNEIEDDLFFQPKDIQKRENEEQKKRKEFIYNTQSQLQNVRKKYEDEKWESEQEKIFLQILLNLHLNENYDEFYHMWYLENKDDKKVCVFDLESHIFWISYHEMWVHIPSKGLDFDPHETTQNFLVDNKTNYFMKKMLKKHFGLNNLSPHIKWFVW